MTRILRNSREPVAGATRALALVLLMSLGLGALACSEDVPPAAQREVGETASGTTARDAAGSGADGARRETPARLEGSGPTDVDPSAAEYVGTARCATCHAEEHEAWQGSHHDLALQTASAEHALGAFDGSVHTAHGVSTRFTRSEGGLRVQTQGEDGEQAEFQVAYLFGVEPLQQLLLPLSRGRVQAFGVAWDARPTAEGGQRWFSLYPDRGFEPGDALHWTGVDQRWSSMCAECHSTGVRANYDPAADAYQVEWAEPDVACEACHGPGSLHVARAEAVVDGNEAWDAGSGLAAPLRNEGRFERAEGARIAQRVPPRAEHAELETCAPCHTRRTLLVERPQAGAPFLDVARPAWIEPGLYHPDGAVEGEVFVTGSFLQSRMHAAGVTCSDCHEPHGLTLRAEGNALCGQCHEPAAYDAPDHHLHAAGSEGAQCVGCHMPATTFMQVDARREHRFGVPRPDLSQRFDVPNACNTCHADRDAAWAAAALGEARLEGRAEDAVAEAFSAARAFGVDAEAKLAAIATDASRPGFVRASAAHALRPFLAPRAVQPLATLVADSDPWVRLAAVGAAEALDAHTRLAVVEPALDDPLLAVRLEAGRVLAPVPAPLWRGRSRANLDAAVDAYFASQALHADRPEALVSAGALFTQLRQPEAAAQAYARALELDPTFHPARLNAADLARAERREPEALAILRETLRLDPENAAALHALGLALVRTDRKSEALLPLRRAAALAPRVAHYALLYGLALNDAGRPEEAAAFLREAADRRPDSRDLLFTWATVERDRGDRQAALEAARRLVLRSPGDPRALALVQSLEQPAP